MTVRDICRIASTELGWSEERIAHQMDKANNLLPHMKYKVITYPHFGCNTERELIDKIKARLQAIDELSPAQK